MKAYKNLEEIRPTLQNKPSGMKADWWKAVKQPASRQMTPRTYSRSQPGSSSSVILSSTMIHQSPPPDLELDHMSSMLAFPSPPIFSKLHSPPLFHGNAVPLVDAKAAVDQGHGEPSLVVRHHCQQQTILCLKLISLLPAFHLTTPRRPTAAGAERSPPVATQRVPQPLHLLDH